jgi:hypothetical protein
MRSFVNLFAAAACVAAVAVWGCVSGLQSAKPADMADSTKEAKAPAQGDRPSPGAKPLPGDKDSLLAAPPTPDKALSSPSNVKPELVGSALKDKDEVTEAALLLAQNVPKVKHIKTCYARASGTWFLYLYVEKGKKLAEETYSWNGELHEWETHGHRKDVQIKQIEFYLRAELPDEKCFLIK